MKEFIIKSKTYGEYKILVDDEDFEKVSKHKWAIHKNINWPYVVRDVKIEGKIKRLILHRYLMGLDFGDKRVVDHINHNTLDNRKCNLRICTHMQNLQNQTSKKKGTSKYLWVTKNKKTNKWRAYIQVNRKLKYLGSFDVEHHAAEAYNKAAIKYFKEFANPNIILIA